MAPPDPHPAATTDDALIASLPPDIYSRNTLIAHGIRRFKEQRGLARARVLDVGGLDGQLGRFLDPEDRLTVLDIRESDDPDVLTGDGTDMTEVADSAYDVVVSADVYEHVPESRRAAFVSEAIRVAGGLVVLAAPFDGAGVRHAEQLAGGFFRELMGEEHRWLEEHFERGLPDHAELEELARSRGQHVQHLPSNDLDNWILLQLLVFFCYRHGIDERAVAEFYAAYDRDLFAVEDFRHGQYRRVYYLTDEPLELELEYRLDEDKRRSLRERAFRLLSSFAESKAEVERLLHAQNLRCSDQATLIEGLRRDLDGARRSIDELAEEVEERRSQLRRTRRRLLDTSQRLEEVTRDAHAARAELAHIRSSITFRLLKAQRAAADSVRRKARAVVSGLGILKREGFKAFGRQAVSYLRGRRTPGDGAAVRQVSPEAYAAFLRARAPGAEAVAAMRDACRDFAERPKISLVTPVYDVDPRWLDRCVQSVLDQHYDEWELCLYDDGSSAPTAEALRRWSGSDPRIHVAFGTENRGIAAATNEALQLATGEYVGFLDHDDELAPDALYQVVRVLNEKRAELIYTDEDFIDESGRRVNPHFKPDYSPDLLLSHNYITHFVVCRTDRVRALDGLRPDYDGAQDHDFLLRLTESIEDRASIVHIPEVLYHWRCSAASTNTRPQAKPEAIANSRRAVADALARRGIAASVSDGNLPFFVRVEREILGSPLVSIVVPFKDEPDLLRTCVTSILRKTRYDDFEIVGVSNNSEESATHETMRELAALDDRVRFCEHDVPFNYAAINNWAVREHARGEHVLLLNNDIEVIEGEWLEAMLEHSQRSEVGAVGAKLLYPTGEIQHAGIIVGIQGYAGHAHKRWQRHEIGYFNRLNAIQNVSAVTAACLMMKKKLFEELGGFDESFQVACNDVDLCLRALEKGYLNVFTPYAQLIHHESMTRGYEDTPEKVARFEREKLAFVERHRGILESGDPFYNPNLTHEHEDFSLDVSPTELLQS